MGNATDPQPRRHKKRKKDGLSRLLIILLCALVVVLLALVLLLLTRDGEGKAPGTSALSDWFDLSAKEGSLPGRTQEEIQAELNRVVEEGMFNISIASIIVFADGEAEGQARIENIPANRYNMSVLITLDETGETLYQSKGLAPGQYIEYIQLDRDLPRGEYDATALFTAHETEDLSQAGQAAAKIKLVIDS